MRAEPFALALLLSLAASGAELTATALPPYLQLGTQPGAQIAISGPDDLSAVSVSTNHGTIGELRQTAPGRFTADYLAPGQTFPRVAIIAVAGTSRGARVHGWTTLPLWGSAEAVLQTAPNANVSVRIGDRTYGPIRADAKGVGKVPVVVPPGVQSGFHGKKVLDLGLPRVALNHVVADYPEVQANKAQTLSVRFYAVAEDGTARSKLKLRARVTAGTITEFLSEAAGVYSAQWALPESPPGEAELSAWALTDPTSTTAIRLKLLAGPAAQVVLTADPSQLVAGQQMDVKLTATVADARGHRAAGAPTFATTLGALGRIEAEGEGAWTTVLAVPKGFGGAAAVVARAEVAGAPAAEVTIALLPGPAQQIRVVPDRLSLVADGTQSADVVVDLLDAAGNRVEGAVNVTASSGELTPMPGGHSYRPARSLLASEAELLLSASGLSARVPVELRPAPSRITFGPKVGFLSNLGNANALTVGLELDFWLARNVGLGLEAGYIFVPRDGEVDAGPLAGKRVLTRAHGVPVLATVSWRARLAEAFKFRATASGGIVVISSRIKLEDQQSVTEGSVVPSAQLTAGVGYALGAWAPFVEVGVRWMGDANGNNLTGSLFSVGVSAGCRFDLL